MPSSGQPYNLQKEFGYLQVPLSYSYCTQLKDILYLPNQCLALQFYAVYAFQARSDQELTLQESQHVRILKFSDLGGNKDWWLAEVNGQKGYVPANYLGKMSYA